MFIFSGPCLFYSFLYLFCDDAIVLSSFNYFIHSLAHSLSTTAVLCEQKATTPPR
eukprot:m.19463 g.19463  ORF g.19463 m.19463 type:complete len:55 (+) comp5121_c0_seq2:2320-2484(+)